MSMKQQAASAGILKPSDLQLLRRVLEITLPAGASEKEREAHACTLITLFKSGIVREDELVETFDGGRSRIKQDRTGSGGKSALV